MTRNADDTRSSLTIKSHINLTVLIAAFSLFLLGIALFGYLEYQRNKEKLYRDIDAKLLTSAKVTENLLTPAFHDRALTPSSLSAAEYDRNIARLSDLAKKMEVIYLYTMVQENGKIYFTASSATDEERKTGINLTHYFQHYEDASDTLKQVFQTHRTRFDEYTDRWGTFRSVFIPMKSPGGHPYVIAADIRIDQIHQLMREETLGLLLRLFGVILFSLPLLLWYLKIITESLKNEKELLRCEIESGEKNLKQNDIKLRAILNATQESIFLLDRRGTILDINSIGASRFGGEPAELIGQSIYPFFPHDLVQKRRLSLKKVFRTGRGVSFEDEWNGLLFAFYLYPVHNDEGKVTTLAVFAKDITDTKKLETDLTNERQHLLNILWGTGAGTWEWNIQTGEYEVNDIWLQMLGYPLKERSSITYTLWKNRLHPEDAGQTLELLQRHFSGELDYYESEYRMRHTNGEWVWVHARGKVISRNGDGDPLWMAGVLLEVTDKKLSEERIHYLANFDPLTGLPNRTQLENHFSYLLSLSKRNDAPCAVIFFDLDRFKEINDSLGHKAGDILLIESAKRLKRLMRESDIVARLGGDEFVIVLSMTDMHGAERVAKKILDAINHPFTIEGYELNTSASLGIALYPSDGLDFDTLSKNADAAMYRAKEEGRDTYRFFTEEMQNRSLRNLQLNNALRNALKNSEFSLLYQPQISMKTAKVIGAEALLRWNNPELGAISPAEFIPLAEENALILPIGEWVLRTAIQQMNEWRERFHPEMVMAVNLSAVQFRHADIVNTVISILEQVGLPPEYLELELTESMSMHDPNIAIMTMNQLHEHGIRMSIDDFGTGYSSLSYLKQFKIYKLKIDQSFVRDIQNDADDKAIVSAIINMAHSLGFHTIAEGVESADQLEFLREQGCDEVQGYYYSKPLTPEDFQTFLESRAE